MSLNFTVMRTDPQLRNAFLAELAARNRSKIRSLVRDANRAAFNLDDGIQVFLIAANAAIDTARTKDDGRGKNDPAA